MWLLEQADAVAALPEVVLAVFAMALLMLGVFRKGEPSGLVNLLAVIGLAIVAELVDRGFKLAHRGPLDVPNVPGAVDWTPDAEALAVNLARLRDKLWAPPRPEFYTYRGRPVGADFYGAMP